MQRCTMESALTLMMEGHSELKMRSREISDIAIITKDRILGNTSGVDIHQANHSLTSAETIIV